MKLRRTNILISVDDHAKFVALLNSYGLSFSAYIRMIESLVLEDKDARQNLFRLLEHARARAIME